MSRQIKTQDKPYTTVYTTQQSLYPSEFCIMQTPTRHWSFLQGVLFSPTPCDSKLVTSSRSLLCLYLGYAPPPSVQFTPIAAATRDAPRSFYNFGSS